MAMYWVLPDVTVTVMGDEWSVLLSSSLASLASAASSASNAATAAASASELPCCTPLKKGKKKKGAKFQFQFPKKFAGNSNFTKLSALLLAEDKVRSQASTWAATSPLLTTSTTAATILPCCCCCCCCC